MDEVMLAELRAALGPQGCLTGRDLPEAARSDASRTGRHLPDALLRPATVAEMSGFLRVCLLFDGGDAAAVEAARARWREVTAAGLAAVYWAQEDARWVRKAASGG